MARLVVCKNFRHYDKIKCILYVMSTQKKKLESQASSSTVSSSHDPAALPPNNLPRYMMPVPYKPITKKERHYVRDHSIFLVRNLDRIEDMKQQRGETGEHNKTEDNNKGMGVSKRGQFMNGTKKVVTP